MRFPFVVCIFACLAVIPLPLSAQSPNANINGLVSDPTSAAVANAEIVVVNDATGVQYTTKTNAEGIYVLPNLPPGPYRVQVSKIGFKTLIKPDIVLNVQDSLSINFTLMVGAFHEIVTVQGNAPLVNADNGAVSTVVDRQFAENLPMNGRSFQTLIYLTPGVVATTSNIADNGQFSVNGQRAESNYWMVDGVSANIGIGAANLGGGNGLGGSIGSFSALGGTNSLVSVDAMQEFRIQTSTYAPEFGRAPGAQISILTRSGTNQFHGSMFDYFRNDVLDANNFFADRSHLRKAAERQNDFGGTLGGPLFKQRTFFFFSYEGLRLRLPETLLTKVPDSSARLTATDAMKPYLNAFPLPNGADDAQSGVAQLNASYSNPATLDAFSLRIDHRLSDRWSIFGRYNYSPSEFKARGLSNGFGALSSVESNQITTQTATVGATALLTNEIANDLRFNFSRARATSSITMDAFEGAIPLSALPFPSSITSRNGLFGIAIFSLGSGEVLTVGKVGENIQNQINIVDGFSFHRYQHNVKIGFDFRRLSPTFSPYTYDQSADFFTVADSQAGNAFFAGIASQVKSTLLFRNLGVYAQDTWHVLSRATITYGVRWDVDFVPNSLSGPNIPTITGYNLSAPASIAIADPGTPPFKTTFGNVAPRVGAAYQVFPRSDWGTVVRGGFGVFFDLASSQAGNLISEGAYTPPFGNSISYFNATFPLPAAEIAPVPIPTSASIANVAAFNPQLKLPYSLQWNASIEQPLGKSQRLSLSYIGARGEKLLQTTTIVSPPANPSLTGFFVDNTASSHYNALQAQFQRRLAQGLQALSSYTWSHSTDDASAGSYFLSSNEGAPTSLSQNWGNSDFDIRHSFTGGVTYDLPALGENAIAKRFANGWSLDTFLLLRSSAPLTVIDQNFYQFNGGIYAGIRPDVVSKEPLYLYGGACSLAFQKSGELLPGQTCPGGKGLNPAAFVDPPTDPKTHNPQRQGDLKRNSLRAFGAAQWDLAIHRYFSLKGDAGLQIRAEMFNLPNRPNFGPPNSAFGSGQFGLSYQTLAQSLTSQNLGGGGFSPLYQIGGARTVQLALKFMF